MRVASTEVPPESLHSDGSQNRVLRFVSRNRSALLLFVVSIVTGCLALALFPRRPAVSGPSPFGMAIFTSGRVESVEIDVVQSRGVGATMTVTLVVELPATPGTRQQPPSGSVDLSLPAALHPTRCDDHPGCNRQTLANAGAHDSKDYQVPLTYDMPELFSATAKASIAIRETDLAWAEDQVNLEGELPQVAVYPDDATSTAPTVSFAYSIPQLARYDFTRGPQPQIALNKSAWSEPTQRSTGEAAIGGANFVVNESDFAGTDHRAEQHDGDSLFLAGALVGIAGGALIGSLQEAIRR